MPKISSHLSGPVALVTGGASFLGRAISLDLARNGFHLILHFQKSATKAKQVATEAEQLGVRVVVVKADLRDPRKIPVLTKAIQGSFDRLDLLVNNASLFAPTPFSTARPIQWQEMFNLNLFAPYFLSRAVAPWLKKNSGSIVNLTDIYGENPILKDYDAYCVSKAGLITVTKMLARELGPDIRVNAVSPGAIFIPRSYNAKKKKDLIARSALKKQGTPEDIAEGVRFLASQSFITGQVLKVDGGRFLS
jgi:pteridine reductase